jgi:hypothetical protein
MLHPKSATQKERKIGEALAFYYKIIIIPLILYIILALAFLPIYETKLLTVPSSAFTGFFSGTPAIGGILSLLVTIPIYLFVSAFLFQIFGKLFKVFSNPYSNTFTATVYGAVPIILSYWLGPVPLVSSLLIIFNFWSLAITILALANQQKTSILKAFAVMIIPTIIIVVGTLILLGIFSSYLVSSGAI